MLRDDRPRGARSSEVAAADGVPSHRVDEPSADRRGAADRAAAGTAPSGNRARDVRRSRLYLFSRRPCVGARPARRRRSLRSRALDVLGLALGLYIALVLRELVYGDTTIYWSLLWEGPRAVAALPRPDHADSSSGRRGCTRRASAARAPGGSSPSLILVAADRALVRARHRLPLLDDRADPDGRRRPARSRSRCCAPPTSRSRSSC